MTTTTTSLLNFFVFIALILGMQLHEGQTRNLYGKSIQMDMTNFMDKYINGSDDSINMFIQDLKSRSIVSVHYMIFDGREEICPIGDNLCPLKIRILKQLRLQNFGVWLMIMGNGFYYSNSQPHTMPTDPNWKSWSVTCLDNVIGSPGLAILSLHREEFRQWQINRISSFLTTGLFDGVQIPESFFPSATFNKETLKPDYGGCYGDVSDFAIKTKFCGEYLRKPSEECDSFSFQKIVSSSSIYSDWIQFRVEAIGDYLWKIRNSFAGFLAFAPWTLAKSCRTDCHPDYIRDPVAATREYSGLDGGYIAALIRPQIIIIQTDPSDYMNPNLQPDYIHTYSNYKKQILSGRSDQPTGIQADIATCKTWYLYGIGGYCARGFEESWYNQLFYNAVQLGYSTVMAYEYWFAVNFGEVRNPYYSEKMAQISPGVVDLYSEPSDSASVERGVNVLRAASVGDVGMWSHIIVNNTVYWIRR